MCSSTSSQSLITSGFFITISSLQVLLSRSKIARRNGERIGRRNQIGFMAAKEF